MKELQQLLAKEAIRDQIYNYCRALDRIDNELGYTIFSDDAEVDYGPTYKGSGRGFIDMMLDQHRNMISTHHSPYTEGSNNFDSRPGLKTTPLPTPYLLKTSSDILSE